MMRRFIELVILAALIVGGGILLGYTAFEVYADAAKRQQLMYQQMQSESTR